MAVVVGVGVGLGAAALIELLNWMQSTLFPLSLESGRPWIFVTVPLGLLVAWFIARRFAPEVAGDGVPEATAALAVHGGRMRARVIPLKILATAATIGTGGSAGREGPIVQIGGAIGSVLSRRFHFSEDQIRSLVAAGAGAGIGASFNAPIAGMLFALEVILVSFAARHMSAIVIASVAAAVTTQAIVGGEDAITAGTYELNSATELFLYAGLAIAVVAVGFFFLRLLDRLEGLADKYGARLGFLRPVGVGLLVAGMIFLEPRLFGTGQNVTNALLLQERISAITGELAEFWWVLLLLAVAKAVATSLTMSSGASGGAFMPSLFMGAAVGTGFARLAELAWVPELDPGAFAVVGMAAMFAVVGRAPLTAILIVFEVTGARDYQLILPLMLTATLATFLAERFSPDSVYSMALKRKGIRIRQTGEIDLLDTIDVGSVMSESSFVAAPSDPLSDVEPRLHRERSHGVPVVRDGKLVGIVTVSDITRAGGASGQVTVEETMTPRPVTVVPSTPVSRAMERMAALGVGRLPVVDEDNPEKLVGMFRREDAVQAYHEALTASTDIEMHRASLAQRTGPGAGYYDFRIPPGSMADGRAIREVGWPEGSTLVSVRRERDVVVPTGDTVLQSGDVITAFGTSTSKNRMIERLNAGADAPTAEVMLDEIGPEESGSEPGSDGIESS